MILLVSSSKSSEDLFPFIYTPKPLGRGICCSPNCGRNPRKPSNQRSAPFFFHTKSDQDLKGWWNWECCLTTSARSGSESIIEHKLLNKSKLHLLHLWQGLCVLVATIMWLLSSIITMFNQKILGKNIRQRSKILYQECFPSREMCCWTPQSVSVLTERCFLRVCICRTKKKSNGLWLFLHQSFYAFPLQFNNVFVGLHIHPYFSAKICIDVQGGDSWEGEIPGWIFWFLLALKREGGPENFSERIFLKVYSTSGIQVV